MTDPCKTKKKSFSGSQIHSCWLKEIAAILATWLTSSGNCLFGLCPPFPIVFLQSLLSGYFLSSSINSSCDQMYFESRIPLKRPLMIFIILLSLLVWKFIIWTIMLRKSLIYSNVIFHPLSPKSSANLTRGGNGESQNHSQHFKENTESRNAIGLLEA